MINIQKPLKMKHLKKILGLMVLVFASACTKSQTEGNGQVSFVLFSDVEIADQTKSNVSQFTALPSTGDFIITITDASKTSVWSGKISDWDSTTQLLAGNYSVTATYGISDEEGFDKPFFTGSADFAVVGGQTTEVEIQASLGNTIVYVECTEMFKNYYIDYSFKLSRDGRDIVTFAKDNTEAAFIEGYKITLSGTITSETKTSQIVPIEYTDLNVATAYKVLFDVSNVGGSTITITFNDTVETIELGDFDLNE